MHGNPRVKALLTAIITQCLWLCGPGQAMAAPDYENGWKTLVSLGKPLTTHQSEALPNGILIVGGHHGDYPLTTQTLLLEPGIPAFAVTGNMTTPRSCFGLATVDGKVYAVGGFAGDTHSHTATASAEVYDPATGSWHSIAPMNEPRANHRLVGCGGRLYAFGGQTPKAWHGSRTVEEYDPIENRWRYVKEMPRAGTMGAAAVGDAIYLLGLGFPDSSELSVHAFKPSDGTWTKLARVPSARMDPAVTEGNGIIYVLGGSQGSFVRRVDAYDTATNKWTRLPDLPYAPALASAATVGNRLYCIGGTVKGKDGGYAASDTVYVLEPRD